MFGLLVFNILGISSFASQLIGKLSAHKDFQHMLLKFLAHGADDIDALTQTIF